MPKLPILLIAAGLLISIAGCVVTGVVYAIQVTGSFNNTMNTATNSDAEAAKLCNEKEKLVTVKGSSQYVPGQGYVSSTSYYCENSEGHRRDVTNEYAATVVGKVGDLFASAFSFRWEFLCVSGVGLLMVVAGIIMLIVKSRSPRATTTGGPFVPLS